ncbi:MAG: hypothetical protein WBP41_16155 [Saprospiraceae bacterium]
MKKLIFPLLILGFLFSIAQGQSLKELNTDGVLLRSNAIETSNNVVLTLKKSDKVQILTTGESWSSVLVNGYVGFIPNKYIVTSPNQALNENSSKTEVLICNSKTAYAYHNHQCRGLLECTHSVSTITLEEAKLMNRTPCKNCYGASSTTPLTSKATPLSPGYSTPPKISSSSQGCSSVQCSGTTQKGARCKNMTTNCSGRCHYH